MGASPESGEGVESGTRSARKRPSRALAVAVALAMIFGGIGILALPAISQVRAEWAQHELATSVDAQIPRYGNAVASAYGMVVSDLESASVSDLESASVSDLESASVSDLENAIVSFEPGSESAVVLGQTQTAPVALGPHPVFSEAVVRIPTLGVSQAVVEGIGRDDLRKGPGHYPGTAVPGYTGNVVISGHRTTYTKPFYDVDLLVPGDAIIIDTREGSFYYLVERTYVVSPDDLSPLAPTDRAILTLTTCTPKGSARDRLVVVAALESLALDAFG